MWGPTGLTADNGEPVEAPLCKLGATWNANNSESHTDVVPPPGEGLITSPCERGQIGPLRNCGFEATPSIVQCDAGQPATATFALPPNAPPQVVRLSEYSHTLMSAIPARYEDSYVPLSPGIGDQPYMLGSGVVTADAPMTLTFTCPSPRTNGTPEPGGTYSVYRGPAFPGDASVALISQT